MKNSVNCFCNLFTQESSVQMRHLVVIESCFLTNFPDGWLRHKEVKWLAQEYLVSQQLAPQWDPGSSGSQSFALTRRPHSLPIPLHTRTEKCKKNVSVLALKKSFSFSYRFWGRCRNGCSIISTFPKHPCFNCVCDHLKKQVLNERMNSDLSVTKLMIFHCENWKNIYIILKKLLSFVIFTYMEYLHNLYVCKYYKIIIYKMMYPFQFSQWKIVPVTLEFILSFNVIFRILPEVMSVGLGCWDIWPLHLPKSIKKTKNFFNATFCIFCSGLSRR